MTADLVKATFNLPQDELDKLVALAGRASGSVTQALRMAISDAHFLDALRSGGSRILVQHADGELYEMTWPVQPPRTGES